jgi:hypothetical protein
VREANVDGFAHACRLRVSPGSISGSIMYMTTTPRSADKVLKQLRTTRGQDRHMATVLPKLRWLYAAQCAAGRSSPNRDDQPNS